MDSGPWVVVFGLIYRILVAIVSAAAPWVAGRIVDAIANSVQHKHPPTSHLWWLVAFEFLLVIAANIFSRAIDYYDRVLADRYTRHVSIEVMKHASALDLHSYENPVFYDRLERARVQATDRLGMIQSIGRLFQQVVTTASLSAMILWYSPWVLLILVVCLIPAFLGESHFAFLNYALNFRQTPVKRELDYLRQVGEAKKPPKN